MKSNQARVNMDTARDIQHDKSIKTKAEKDRRLKEKQSNNTKVDRPLKLPNLDGCDMKAFIFHPLFQLFIDERKTAAIRQDNRLKKLQKIHKDQEDDLQRFMQSVSNRSVALSA